MDQSIFAITDRIRYDSKQDVTQLDFNIVSNSIQYLSKYVDIIACNYAILYRKKDKILEMLFK